MAKTAPPAAELLGRRGRLQGQGSTAASPAAPPHPTLASIGRSRTFTIEKEEDEAKDADEKKNQKVSFDRTLSATGPGSSVVTPAAMPTPAPRERRQRPPAGDGADATPERPAALGLGVQVGVQDGEAPTAPVPAPRRAARTRVSSTGEPVASTAPSEEAQRPAEADAGRWGGRRRLLRRQAAGESSSSDAESARGRGGQKIVLVTEAEVHEPPSAARSEVVRKARPEQGASRRGSAIPEALLDEIKRMSQTSQASQDSTRSVEEGTGDTPEELSAGGGDRDVVEAPDAGGADALLEAYEEPAVVPTATPDGEVNTTTTVTTTTTTTTGSHSAEGILIVPIEQTDAPSHHDDGVHVEQAASAPTPPETDSDDVSFPSVAIPEAPIQDLPGADPVELHPPVTVPEEQPSTLVPISDENPSSVDVPEEQPSPKTDLDEQPPIEAVLEDHPPALQKASYEHLSPTTTDPEEEQPPIVTTAEEHPLLVTAPEEVVTPPELSATSCTQGEPRSAPLPALPTSPPPVGQGLHKTEPPEPESHDGAAETPPGHRAGRGDGPATEVVGVGGPTTGRTLHRMDDSTRERLQRHIERAVLGAAGGPPVSREALQAGLDQASAALAAFYATPSSEAEAVRLRSEELLSRLRRLKEEVSASVVFPVSAGCRVAQSGSPVGSGPPQPPLQPGGSGTVPEQC
ncbi:fibrous sheath CABYR-binding protein-like isoform X1 [Frankliniella occidentalis]|uniref:Fibrous sheath CABYR-binding protein-like isoform X1 n=2 Tax=Frankliniella occidentalis TaxID=133901 RepID=A0A9C6X9K2_FRAOC|nr:fibrous sheath CABYR-binding protein-like isoform X1 [Frankliniella occidentalis]XP_052131569.1 fibrous sheath CABYR-binding protein-like isoform X1 [Frankliniella occidentalis]